MANQKGTCTRCGVEAYLYPLKNGKGAHCYTCRTGIQGQLDFPFELPEGVHVEQTGGFNYALAFDVSPAHQRLLTYEGDDPDLNGGGRFWVGDYLRLDPSDPTGEYIYGEEYQHFDNHEEALAALSDPNPTPTKAYLSTLENWWIFTPTTTNAN